MTKSQRKSFVQELKLCLGGGVVSEIWIINYEYYSNGDLKVDVASVFPC